MLPSRLLHATGLRDLLETLQHGLGVRTSVLPRFLKFKEPCFMDNYMTFFIHSGKVRVLL